MTKSKASNFRRAEEDAVVVNVPCLKRIILLDVFIGTDTVEQTVGKCLTTYRNFLKTYSNCLEADQNSPGLDGLKGFEHSAASLSNSAVYFSSKVDIDSGYVKAKGQKSLEVSSEKELAAIADEAASLIKSYKIDMNTPLEDTLTAVYCSSKVAIYSEDVKAKGQESSTMESSALVADTDCDDTDGYQMVWKLYDADLTTDRICGPPESRTCLVEELENFIGLARLRRVEIPTVKDAYDELLLIPAIIAKSLDGKGQQRLIPGMLKDFYFIGMVFNNESFRAMKISEFVKHLSTTKIGAMDFTAYDDAQADRDTFRRWRYKKIAEDYGVSCPPILDPNVARPSQYQSPSTFDENSSDKQGLITQKEKKKPWFSLLRNFTSSR